MSRRKGIIWKTLKGIFGLIILFVLVVFVNLIIAGKNESVISKGVPIENYGRQKCALLIVDIQEATTGDVSVYPFFKEHSDNLIKSINQTIDSFQMLNMPVIYVRSEITNPLINLVNSTYAKGSPGVKYDKRLKIVSDLEVVKNVKDSFRKTLLDSILISNKVNEMYIVGLDAAECVNATVEAAQNRGYRVHLVEEAVLSKSKEKTDSMMMIFRKAGVRVIPLNSLHLMEVD